MSAVVPLAEKLRPADFVSIAGQEHITAPDKPLGRMIASGKLASFILWGPPGSGKTTIVRVLAQAPDVIFAQASATSSGLAAFREVFQSAAQAKDKGQHTLLFVDEIHRLTRTQQDAFLPYMEDGTIILAGATTDNPSFTLSAALLSRAQVYVLERLATDALEKIACRAEEHIRPLPLTNSARAALLAMADGDGRFLLNMVELIFDHGGTKTLDEAGLAELLQAGRAPLYDRGGDQHYNLISALHKSVRGSDAQAALYWLQRMLASGEDPLYIARRLIRMANEDIGLADPQAVEQTLSARRVYEALGSPEGELALAQAAVYLACAPKSNALYKAAGAAKAFAAQTGSHDPPKHILNAPTSLMKKLGYGKNYRYDHDETDLFSGQNYFPDALERQEFYTPRPAGFEREIIKRLNWWEQLRRKKQQE